MLKLKSTNQWSILVLLAVLSLSFQNCSNSSSSDSTNSDAPVNLTYAESISQLNLHNNSLNSEVKDSYLYVGDIYSVGFLNLFIRNGAELIIEIESSSTAACSLNAVTTSKQAYIGSCSQQGLLDLKITFNNPGKPSAIEKRQFFVINRISDPVTPLPPVGDPTPSAPPVVDVDKATPEYLTKIGYSIVNHAGSTLKELKLYTLKYENKINLGDNNYVNISVVKSNLSTASCKLSTPTTFVFTVSINILCESSGTLKFEIIQQHQTKTKYVEYIVEVPTANEPDFSHAGVFLYAKYSVPALNNQIFERTVYPHTGSAIELFYTMDNFEYGVYTNALMNPERVKFEVLSYAGNSGSPTGFLCSFDSNLKPVLKPNALGTLKCKGYGTMTIKISYIYSTITLSKTSTHSVY